MRHPQDVHQVEQQLQQLCPESPDVTLEMRIVSSNGTVRWGQFAFRAFFNAHGALTETQAVGRDITEHKALQAQLAGAAQEIADLYENAPTGYHSLDARGVFQRANKIELAWLGCSRAELIGRLAITDFLDDEGKALFRSSFPTLIAHGQIEGLEFALIGRDGRRRDVRVNASAVRDAEGNFVMSRSVTDIPRFIDFAYTASNGIYAKYYGDFPLSFYVSLNMLRLRQILRLHESFHAWLQVYDLNLITCY